MKKVIAILLSTSLLLCLFSSIAYGESVEIGHQVAAEDSFQVEGKNITKFTGTTAVEVAEVTVINNTRDGYKVELSSLHGALHSDSDANGEEDIPYTLTFAGSGSSPSDGNGFTALNIPEAPPTDPTLILGAASALSGNGLLNKPTNLEFTIKVAIDDASFIKMAGTYADELTITYSDN